MFVSREIADVRRPGFYMPQVQSPSGGSGGAKKSEPGYVPLYRTRAVGVGVIELDLASGYQPEPRAEFPEYRSSRRRDKF